MYISTLLINVGDNPDRPRPGRTWLRNLYHVHQRLCMAFPTTWQKENDPEFLKPYQPCGFHDPRPERCAIPVTGPRPCVVSGAERPIHVPRDSDHNFLFRIDPRPGASPVIVVQSAIEPNWKYAFHNAGYLLACIPNIMQFDPDFQTGQSLRFRLAANPTRKIDTKTGPDGKKNNGQRVPVRPDPEHLEDWLKRQGERCGFSIEGRPSIQTGYVYARKPDTDKVDKPKPDKDYGRRRLVRYDGILKVTNPGPFRQALISGIGPGKAFGFGLLSVAPLRGELRGEMREVGGET